MMHDYGMSGYMHSMTPIMWVFMILIWGFAIFGLVSAIMWLVEHERHNKSHQ